MREFTPWRIFDFTHEQKKRLPTAAAFLCKQSVDRGEGVPRLLPAGQQLIQNLGIGLRSRVEQNNCAVVSPGQQLLEGLFPGGLRVVVPIGVGKAPENGPVAQLLGKP